MSEYPVCPKCDRELKTIQDYPLVRIVKFERLNIPEGIVFPNRDWKIFVGPKSKTANRRPPKEVIDFFTKNRCAERFDFGDWSWSYDSRHDSYSRFQDDAKPTILSHINNYFDSLEKLVGLEVQTRDALPKFSGGGYESYHIPGTEYDLDLLELNQMHEPKFTQTMLSILKLETQQETRKLVFSITYCEGGSFSEVEFLANIGGIAYEGILRT